MDQKLAWLDCDPGHDDATAILLALHSPNLHLLGISTVHGNTDALATSRNAARCCHAFAAPAHVKVYPGASVPLLREARHDPEIHGADGLGGVQGLVHPDSTEALSFIATNESGFIRALEGLSQSIRHVKQTGRTATILATGPLTNIALFISVYPDLLDSIEQIVFMGGGIGLGNRSAVAEFNILCDPEAAQIVLQSPVKTVMVPINCTHQAIVSRKWQAELLAPGAPSSLTSLPCPASKLRYTISTLIQFFADAYASTFGFADGPPLHDALTVAYLSDPNLFRFTRYKVDVELRGEHSTGETVVDVWRYQKTDNSWGRRGQNCLVLSDVNVEEFFKYFLDCVSRCDKVSPLNVDN